MRVLVFGDSISYGAWDSQGGWVDRLKRWTHGEYIRREVKFQVINLGIGGDTSRGIRQRLEGEIIPRVSTGWRLAIILMFGTNDGRVKDGKIEVPIEEFRQNCEDIIRTAQTYASQVTVVGLPPLAAPSVLFKDMQYSDRTIMDYESALRERALAHGVSFIEVRPTFDAATMLFRDGIHPNDAGHTHIYELVREQLALLVG